MIGSLLRIGIAGRVVLADVVEQAGDRERLPVAQLDIRFGAPRRERRDPEALERDAVGEVERADLRPDLQSNHVAGNRRLEVQPDAELLEDDRHGVRRAALRNGNRELAAGEEAGFLAVVGNQVRLGQALEPALGLERLDDAADAFLACRRRTDSGNR